MKHVYTIKKEDIGKIAIKIVICKHCGATKTIHLNDFMGPVQPLDVGKRIAQINAGQGVNRINKIGESPIYGVESQEQLEERLRTGKQQIQSEPDWTEREKINRVNK